VRGKVLSFSQADGTGLISGEDGQRYGFTVAALQAGGTMLFPGAEVDFEVQDGAAVGIYVIAPSSRDKDRIVAALLALFVGHWGVHKFYLGKTNAGIIMLVCGTIGWMLVLPGVINWAIAIIEGVIYLVKSDQDFYRDYVVGDRTWL
jgi:TM2 domain-containing membrane protein YozV/cold shock CspA family protein